EKIYANRKIRCVKKRAFALLNQLTHFVQVLRPAGRTHNHGNAAFSTADDVGDHGMRRGEVENYVNLLEQFRGESASVLVFLAGQRTHFMSALLGHFGDERAGFAAAEDENFHENTSGSTSEKKTWWSRETTLGTSSSSITKLILISEAP